MDNPKYGYGLVGIAAERMDKLSAKIAAQSAVIDECEKALKLTQSAFFKIPVRNKIEEEAFINCINIIAKIKSLKDDGLIDVIQDKFEAFLNQSIVDAVEKFDKELGLKRHDKWCVCPYCLAFDKGKNALSALKSRVAGK